MNFTNRNRDDRQSKKLQPPRPDLSHLTEEELLKIKDVLKKQENFEKEIDQSIKYSGLASLKSPILF